MTSTDTRDAPQLDVSVVTGRIRKEVERGALRLRNGIKYAAGTDRPKVGTTPRDTVWKRDKAELWRYRTTDVRYRPPVFIVMSLVSRSYILDLQPDNTFIGRLIDGGFQPYLLDWGVPGPEDSANTLDYYVDELLDEAVYAVCEDAGTDDVTMLGYCFGGVLSLLGAAGHPEWPLRNLALMATPVDFHQMGLMADLVREGRLDPEQVIDETGNIPPDVIRETFRLLKPTGDLQTYATLWQNLWNDEFMEGFQAFGQWTRDHIPFAGAAAQQSVDLLIRGNSLMQGRFAFGGREIDLGAISCPTLNIMAEKDHIVPVQTASPLLDLLEGTSEKTDLRLDAGHVALVASRRAAKTTIPKIMEWIAAHSEDAGDDLASAS